MAPDFDVLPRIAGHRLPPPIWLCQEGPEADVVVSTRCRLARNLAGRPFPWRADELQRKEAARDILEAAERTAGGLTESAAIRAEELGVEELARLREWRYASRDWAHGGSNRWILIARDRISSVLVNEEDHLRLQAILPGLLVESIQSTVQKLEEELSRYLDFARDDRFGYLTASLANTGAGMRVSVLLHLPGLAAEGTLATHLEAAAAVGCAVRGLYGEGTHGTGELFQVSNTCARKADATVTERVGSAVRYLIEAERRARREQFDTAEGRVGTRAAIRDALAYLFQEEAAPRRLLPLVSVLRLGVSEQLLAGTMAQTAEWVALAGAEAAEYTPAAAASERYEAVRRSAALRQRLREILRAGGQADL